MNDRAHVIEIDSIVLSGVDSLRPWRLTALIEAEIERVLGGSGLPATTIANGETSVAGEVARTLVRSIHGGVDDV